ncbi:MAG: S8 family serine peptidase [Gammaproteobacteria bacterium]|nr:S8 family serine peptidase [Gammaproteobacteria bacterium]
MKIKIISLALVFCTMDTMAAKHLPFEYQNNPVGIRAIESFSGTDRAGKDGAMAKIGFDLTLLYHEHRDYLARGGVKVLKRAFKSSLPLIRLKNEKVVIDTVASGDVNKLVKALSILGMENIATYGRMVSGYLPVSQLEKAAGLTPLKLARPAYARVMTGSVTSQGDAAMLADNARTSFGVNGSGITIGTLSDSYNCLGGAAGDVTTNDLPAGITVLTEETGCGSGTDEGRAIMQIIHDVAPGANQAFHTAFDGTASFAAGIIDLATVANADIINDDVIYYAEPMFQDGIIAQAVDSVKAMGVAYFSAAGNQASQSYEATFVDSGIEGYSTGSVQHDFNAGSGTDALMQVTIPGNTQVIFVFQWDDPFFSVSGSPGADTDMDIILYSSSGRALAGGVSDNIGGDAVEVLGIITKGGPTKTYQIGIERFSGPNPGKIKFSYFGNMTINEYATNSSTSYGHPIAAGGQAVGAVRYSQTPDYGVSPPILEYFSSKGGTPILFDVSGNPVNEIRQKPDFTAPNGGNTTFFGSDYEGDGWPNFFGTSAAVPHAAGLAALLKEFDNNLGPDSIYATMQNTAIDMGAAGFDFESGYGLIQATLALASLDADGDTVPDSIDNCPSIANPDQADNDNDTQGDVCDLDDDNDGLSDSLETDIGSNPFLADTDGDTISDYDEVAYDGNDTTYTPGQDLNPNSDDTDGDGYTDNADPIPLTFNFNDGDLAPAGSPDGVINIADFLIGMQLISDQRPITTLELSHGDLYPPSAPDGLITLQDILLLQQMIIVTE